MENLGTPIIIPFVISSEAGPIQSTTKSENTHEWKICFRIVGKNLQLQSLISSVTFKLHESFANPNRVIHQPPYEVQEKGWGEFVINVKVSFKSSSIRPITVAHTLRLHPNAEQLSNNDTVISKTFDEIVISGPSQNPVSNTADYSDDVRFEIEAEQQNIRHMIEHISNIAKD